jgi:hypothetical protein
MFTVTYLASGGKIGDIIKAEVTCDKCTLLYILLSFVSLGLPSWVDRILILILTITCSRQDARLHVHPLHERAA